MPTVTPRRVMRTATRTSVASSAATVLIAGAWGAQLWTGHAILTLMVFAIFLAIAIVSGVAMVTARCHLAIAQAFAAGAASARTAPNPPAHMRTAPLRVVD